MKLNNKGFTLVEVLAVIAIIAIIGLIAVPNVLSLINTGDNTSYGVMIGNIKVAAQSLFEEVENTGDSSIATIETNADGDKYVIVTLQTLVDYGFLNGSGDNANDNKKLINPKNKKDIGDCTITVVKHVDSNSYKVTYIINSSDTGCPTSSEYANS